MWRADRKNEDAVPRDYPFRPALAFFPLFPSRFPGAFRAQPVRGRIRKPPMKTAPRTQRERRARGAERRAR